MSSGLPTRPQFVPLAVGLATETVEKLVQPGSVTRLENAHQDHLGQITKRTGSAVMSEANQATIPSGGTLPDAHRLATINGALARFNVAPVPIHLWTPGDERWVRPAPDSGGLISYRRGPLSVDTVPVMAGVVASAQVGAPDVAYGEGYAVSVFDYTNAGSNFLRVAFTEVATGTLVAEYKITGGHTGRVHVVQGLAVVAYVVNTDIHVDTYSLSTLAAVDSATFGACNTGTFVDIRPGSIRAVPTATDVSIIYTYDDGLVDTIYCLAVDATDLTDDETFLVAGSFAPVGDLAIGWLQDFGGSNRFSVMGCDSTNGLYVLWDLATPVAGTSTATATHILDAGATAAPSGSTPGVRNVIGSTTSTLGIGAYRVCYEVTAPDLPHRAVIKTACWSGASATTGTVLRGTAIRSKFWRTSTDLYFLSAFDAADQRTYFIQAVGYDLTPVTTSSPAPLAVVHVRSAGGVTERRSHPSSVAFDEEVRPIMAVTYETRTESIASSGVAIGTESNIRAVGLVIAEHREAPDTELGQPQEFAQNVFTPGAALGAFDGHTYGMPGFAYYPPDLSAATAAGGNLEPEADYVYRYLYSFVDHNGRKWRSAPSIPYPVSTTVTDFQIDLTLDTLRVYDRGNSSVSGYQIEVYRTLADAPGAYFLVASIANDPSVNTVALSDNVADIDLGEELYTDGNTLENQLLPAISHCKEFQNRLVCAEAGTATIWYSLPSDLIHGLTFNEALTLDVGDPSDPITGLAVVGTRLVAFKARSTYIVYGEGANALNQGGTYTAEMVDPTVGCVNASSILSTSQGVFFRGNSDRVGIYRTVGGPAEYIGQGVRDYNDLAITGAVVVTARGELQWFTEEGRTLVLNTATNTWSTNTGQETLAATYFGGVTYANADGQVMQAAAEYLEGETAYSELIRSPWLSFAGMKGWERIKRILLVGAKGGAHKCTVRLYRNFDGTTPFATYEKQFTGDEPWEFKVRPLIQKLTSLLVEVEITAYQAPVVSITPGTDTYDGLDVDSGQFRWTFENGDFDAGHVGAEVVIAGDGDKDGTYTIVAVVDSDTVAMTPAPAGSAGAFEAATITMTPAPEHTAGPGITGMTLIVGIKRGAQKLGPSSVPEPA